MDQVRWVQPPARTEGCSYLRYRSAMCPRCKRRRGRTGPGFTAHLGDPAVVLTSVSANSQNASYARAP